MSRTSNDVTPKQKESMQKSNRKVLGSGALSVKMLLVRIVENNKIDDYFR